MHAVIYKCPDRKGNARNRKVKRGALVISITFIT